MTATGGRAALPRGPNIRAARQHRPTVNQYTNTSAAACSARSYFPQASSRQWA